jgi:hypothetical protein
VLAVDKTTPPTILKLATQVVEIANLEMRFFMKASRQNSHKLQSILDLTC